MALGLRLSESDNGGVVVVLIEFEYLEANLGSNSFAGMFEANPKFACRKHDQPQVPVLLGSNNTNTARIGNGVRDYHGIHLPTDSTDHKITPKSSSILGILKF